METYTLSFFHVITNSNKENLPMGHIWPKTKVETKSPDVSSKETKQTKVKIRKGTQRDLDAIKTINTDAFAAPEERFSSLYLQAFLNEPHFYVAEFEDGKPVGFVFAARQRHFRGEIREYTEANKIEPMMIVKIAVVSSSRGQGIGTQLMKHINTVKYELEDEKEPAEKKAHCLYVRRSNVLAQKFYERLGFVVIHPIKAYYAAYSDVAGEDAIFMLKSF